MMEVQTDAARLAVLESLDSVIANYVCSFKGSSELGWETAYLCLVDAVIRALDALRSPDCVKLLGPIVPGATMARGSRVIGTSYELDPVQAAYSLGTMFCWEPKQAVNPGHPCEHLGALLGTADYLSRRATASGTQPPIVRDLMLAMITAHEVRSLLGEHGAIADHLRLVHIASTASVTRLLGGDEVIVARALRSASAERFPASEFRPETGELACNGQSAGDVASRAVRTALMTISGAIRIDLTPVAETLLTDRKLALPRSPGCQSIEALLPCMPPIDDRLQKLDTIVVKCFSAAQSAKIRATLADRHACTELPVHDFVALFVRN